MSVTVLCPNAHRCKITTTPGKLLQEVHEEACMRQGYDSSKYGLQFQRRFLDLSLPIRLCDLPNNATLELIKRESLPADANVQVAVQGEFGRHQQNFPASTSLAQILEVFTPLIGIDLLCKSEESIIPAIGYMNKLYKGVDVLCKSTLKSIGIDTGRALFRYSQIHATPEELEQMRQSVAAEEAKRLHLIELYNKSKEENEQRAKLDEKYTKEIEDRERQRLANQERLVIPTNEKQIEEQVGRNQQHDSSTVSSTVIQPQSRLSQLEHTLNTVSASLVDNVSDNLVDQIVRPDGHLRIGEQLDIRPVNLQQQMSFANFKFPDTPVATFGDLMLQESSSVNNSLKVPERCPIIFKRHRQQNILSEFEEPDEFFELTVSEAKKIQRDLGEQVKQLSQQALLPKSFMDKRNKERKLLAYRHCVLRIRIEEHVLVQAQFLSAEPVEHIFQFVASILQPDTPKFYLTLPLNQKLDALKSSDLIDAELAPVSTVSINFQGIQSSKAFVRPETVQECTEEDANTLSREWLSVNSQFRPEFFAVDDESETQLKRRNRDESLASPETNQRRSLGNSQPLPKWFKRN